jgi:hypothetical protein
MPHFRSKTWAGILYTGVFLFGVLVACGPIEKGQYLWSMVFLALWPGTMLSTTILVFDSVTDVEVQDIAGKVGAAFISRSQKTPGKVGLAFIYGELELVGFLLFPFGVVLFPFLLLLIVLLFVFLGEAAPDRQPVPELGAIPARRGFSHMEYVRRYDTAANLRELERLQEENYEHRLHFAMGLQERLHRG